MKKLLTENGFQSSVDEELKKNEALITGVR